MPVFNYPSLATSTSKTAQCGLTVSAIADVAHQVVGFTSTASTNATVVTLVFGSTTKMTFYASSTVGVSEYYGLDGPITAKNEKIEVWTKPRGGATDWCANNLLYRRVTI